ncbi:hypothetical protein N9335_02625 [Crocinitomicaceae bacterium]|nr:hypothetical protein [Crocinitomicaceae bacterium]
MNFTKSIVFVFCFGVIVSSCETNEPAVISKEVKPKKIIFDSRFVEDLYGKLQASSEDAMGFSQQQLIDFLKIADPEELKKGNSYGTELLFESFKCNCLDEISISYDENKDAFILSVYEEAYVEDLDWCPESSYEYSFEIQDQKAENVKFDFLAG